MNHLIEKMAIAIHNAEHRREPWKKFDTLHPDDQDEYRTVAAILIAELGLDHYLPILPPQPGQK